MRHFTGPIRVIVVHELPQEENNSLLHLFSARMDLLRYGATHYRVRSEETSTLLLQLFERYRLEARLMPDALEQFAKETIDELLKKLPAEELLKRLSVDDLKKLPAEELLERLSVDELWAALRPDKRAGTCKALQ